MKKVFLTLALAAFAFAANAQFVVSGNLGFNHNGEKYTVDGKDNYTANPQKNNGFNLNLKGGYQLTDQIQVGLLLGFNSYSNITESPVADPTKVDNTVTIKNHTFNVGVYGRYNFMEFNKLTLFAEASIDIAMGGGKTETEITGTPTATVDDPKTFGFNFDIVPGISYKLTDHLSAELYLDMVSLGFHMAKTTWDKTIATSGTEETYTYTDFGFNAETKDMSITGFNNTVRIGVAFNF